MRCSGRIGVMVKIGERVIGAEGKRREGEVFLKMSAQKHDRLIILRNFQSKRLPGGLFLGENL